MLFGVPNPNSMFAEKKFLTEKIAKTAKITKTQTCLKFSSLVLKNITTNSKFKFKNYPNLFHRLQIAAKE